MTYIIIPFAVSHPFPAWNVKASWKWSLCFIKKTKTYSYSHHPYCCYVYIPSTNPFAHPSCLYYYLLSPIYCFCTSYLFLHILLVLHILFCTFLYPITLFTLYFSFLPIYIYALVWCYFYIICILCTVHWADLIWSTFHFWLYPV